MKCFRFSSFGAGISTSKLREARDAMQQAARLGDHHHRIAAVDMMDRKPVVANPDPLAVNVGEAVNRPVRDDQVRASIKISRFSFSSFWPLTVVREQRHIWRSSSSARVGLLIVARRLSS